MPCFHVALHGARKLQASEQLWVAVRAWGHGTGLLSRQSVQLTQILVCGDLVGSVLLVERMAMILVKQKAPVRG